MLQVLADNTFLTLFLVIAMGAGLGAIPFAGIRFGAAGTLFVGLAVGAIIPDPAGDLAMLQSLGLGLFVYLVGLEAGETFFRELKSQLGAIVTGIIAIAAGAVVAVLSGLLLQASREVIVGAFSGALTNTPSLSLAQTQTGSDLPAVGYSLGYPVGVVVAILVISFFIRQTWKAPKDQINEDDAILEIARLRVDRPMTVRELGALAEGSVRVGPVRRGSDTRVPDADHQLEAGDVVIVHASKSAMPEVIRAAGRKVPRRRLRDQNVAVHRFTVSNSDLAGRCVEELPLYAQFRSRITRIRRVDQEILATPEVRLEEGDVVEVFHPVGENDALAGYFGDSAKGVSEVDLVVFAGGLTLGYLAALIVIPLPAGASFALGSAAGPLIVGLILGALGSTPGGRSLKLPRTANYTLRQFGLMLFLAAVGVASGPAFAATALTRTGLVSVIIALCVTATTCLAYYLMSWLRGQSVARATGGVAGLLSQPAVLQYGVSRSSDGRIMTAYSTLVTVAVLVKIVAVPLILAVI